MNGFLKDITYARSGEYMFDVPQCQEVIKIIEKGDFKNAQL